MNGVICQLTDANGNPIELQVGENSWVEPGAEIVAAIDLRRFFVLAGLADCHAHLSADSLTEVERGGEMDGIRRRAFAQLSRGVFLVVDKGWRDDVVLLLLDEPPKTRPHLRAAGRIITGAGGYFPGFAVETDENGLVDAIKQSDISGGWIKVIGDWPQKGRGPVISFGEEALAQACRLAHAAGARIAIHTMAPETPGIAVRAGVDSIEHGLYLTGQDLEALGARGGAWVPTIGNTQSVLASLGSGSSGARILGAGLVNVQRLLPGATEAGVVVLAGTDLGIPHGEVAREAELLNGFGLSGARSVDAVGPAAYRYLGIPFLTPGASADLVLFDEDPYRDVAVLRRPVAAMRAGTVVFDRVGALSVGGKW
ncbi:MAG: amidohydrolase family protein [Acidimicrobiia bacterium]